MILILVECMDWYSLLLILFSRERKEKAERERLELEKQQKKEKQRQLELEKQKELVCQDNHFSVSDVQDTDKISTCTRK